MKSYLQIPDWSATRAIYKKLSDELHVLTDAYSIEIDPQRKIMLDHLILGIDAVDESIDKLPTSSERTAITNSILNYLSDEEKTWQHPLANSALEIDIQNIKYIVGELKVEERFHEAASKIFDFTERKRHTKNEKEFIHFIKEEGRNTAELPLSIMGIESTHPFAIFFHNLCMLMGIADLIIDAKSDYKLNYIVIKPTLGLYVRLNILLIKEGLKLIWNFPRKIKLILYCVRFTILLIRAKD